MRRQAAVLFLGLAAGSCGPEQAPPAPGEAPPAFTFVDGAQPAGVTRTTWCGRPEKPHILESGGSGLALLDHDEDGDLDLYLVNGWRLDGTSVAERGGNALYRNAGNRTFADVTESASVGDDGWGCGVAVGDADGDGALDLFVTSFGPDRLYLNQRDGTFRAQADGPGIDGWSTGAVLFDADQDGDEDLFVVGYIDAELDDVLGASPSLPWKKRLVMKGPFGLEGEADRYFENLGQGRFREATRDAGLEDVGLFYGFTVLAFDFDQDLDLDLFVANDSNPNYLYRNVGAGRFEEVGLWSGAAVTKSGSTQAGMGVAAGDVDDDGRTDLGLTTFAEDSATLFRNLGACLWSDESRRFGLLEPTLETLEWGTALEDFDLDGDLDLFIACGHIYPQADEPPETGSSYRQANLLLARQGETFVEVGKSSGPGLAVVESSRGVASGDLDGDGDVDLVVSNVDAPPTLLWNESARRGAWITIDAPGALRVTLELGDRRRVRDAVRGGSYVSASDTRFHFGLGPVEKVDRARVLWPDGAETLVDEPPLESVVRVTR